MQYRTSANNKKLERVFQDGFLIQEHGLLLVFLSMQYRTSANNKKLESCSRMDFLFKK